MPRAEVKASEGTDPLPCPNCGRYPHGAVKVFSEGGRLALHACDKCWPESLRRGQLEAVKAMCRAADRAAGPAQDVSALR